MAAKTKSGEGKKVRYFNSDEFVKKVLTDCELGDVEPALRAQLEEMVERRLAERITATIINSFTPRDLEIYQKVLQDHPELDDMDAMTVVAADIPGLQEKMLKGVNDLYEELTYDARGVQKAMDDRAASEKIKL